MSQQEQEAAAIHHLIQHGEVLDSDQLAIHKALHDLSVLKSNEMFLDADTIANGAFGMRDTKREYTGVFLKSRRTRVLCRECTELKLVTDFFRNVLALECGHRRPTGFPAA